LFFDYGRKSIGLSPQNHKEGAVMVLYQKIFPRKAFLPVIHVREESVARRSANIARENGADGIFLINHDVSSSTLHKIYGRIRQDHPNWWIGLNCLDQSAEEMISAVPGDVSAVWSDSMASTFRYAEIRSMRKDWGGLYFGGVAFKYRPAVSEQDLFLISRAVVSTKCADVITTSGEKTGTAPSVEKIKIIREAIGDFPLAIASGISSKNVRLFLPNTNAFLVASSIGESFYVPNAEKTRELADLIHAN